MTKDDILYVSFFYSILVAALIDRYYVIDRYKGKYGAAIGIIALFCLCGSELFYPLVNIVINTAIICFCWKRWSGVVAFSFTSAYLFYFRFYCSASSITNMFMMSSTLKVISVAFDSSMMINETNNVNKCKKSPENIILYVLHYNGLIGVPYYTFKTYCEYINLPFKHHSREWQYSSLVCVIDSFIIMLGRQFLNLLWPFSYILTDEFHNKRSIFYRIWFIYPVGFDFILRIYNAFVMTSASCFISGIGAYPDFTKSKCGHGPTENIEIMAMLSKESMQSMEVSYKTIQNVNLKKVHFSIQFKESIKYWNQTIQFWLYTYVYRMVPYSILKKPATMLFSSYWHGLQIGNFSSLFFSSLVIYIEERWERILRGRKYSPIETYVRIILKLHILYNLIFTFVSQEWNIIVGYQTSVYWNSVVILILLLSFSFLVKEKSA